MGDGMLQAVPSPVRRLAGGAPVIDYRSPLSQDTSDREDTELVDRLRAQDPEALRELYGRFSRPVFGYLLRFLPDRATAEDVQQQVFLEVWQKSDRFDAERGSLMTWVMTIARSRAIDSARRRVPEPRDPEMAARTIDQRPGAEDEIGEVVAGWQFSQLIGQLPDDEADLLRYRFHNELTQTEIADRTGIPLGTVKSRMVSALERLRRMMEAEA